MISKVNRRGRSADNMSINDGKKNSNKSFVAVNIIGTYLSNKENE